LLNPGWNAEVDSLAGEAQGLVEQRYLDREGIDRDRQGDKDPTEMGCIHMGKTVIVAKIVVIVDSRTLCSSFSTTDAPSILPLSPSYVPYLVIEIKTPHLLRDY